MSFIGELFSKLDGGYGYCVINFGGKFVYAEGIEKLVSISASAVNFVASKKQVVIEGEGLEVEDLDCGTAVIKGKIVRVEEK